MQSNKRGSFNKSWNKNHLNSEQSVSVSSEVMDIPKSMFVIVKCENEENPNSLVCCFAKLSATKWQDFLSYTKNLVVIINIGVPFESTIDHLGTGLLM